MSEPASGEVFELEWIPGQLFPDIELERVEVDEQAIRIVCSDGDWSIQSDIILFWGSGTMVFEVDGDIAVRIREGERWPLVAPSVAKEKLFPYLHTLEVIERGDPWRLRFRAGDLNAAVELQAAVTRITWYPDDV
ncbi:hypothetical protein [Halomonas llamarensis]|uniref:Uncharacterized protein n=1 Tax=Halomonas llamarensis TaxID=2945104 RepID=A0ABT0SRX3_9GAMM|nr:hypothetical protein [Halomonas llamarensis]MCL7930563.1 hypothetical protein [Halomonas llamarensis]